ncbi:MAG TPA: hypothetical protein VEV85_19410 [Bryobacteraceae bacterium]|nr:hypothetical protein [Bryobacteraceae bacterium]
MLSLEARFNLLTHSVALHGVLRIHSDLHHRGKLPSAHFDHWYYRSGNELEAVWMVCASYNRSLEDPHFKAFVHSYPRAVMVVLAEARQELRLFDSPA